MLLSRGQGATHGSQTFRLSLGLARPFPCLSGPRVPPEGQGLLRGRANTGRPGEAPGCSPRNSGSCLIWKGVHCVQSGGLGPSPGWPGPVLPPELQVFSHRNASVSSPAVETWWRKGPEVEKSMVIPTSSSQRFILRPLGVPSAQLRPRSESTHALE